MYFERVCGYAKEDTEMNVDLCCRASLSLSVCVYDQVSESNHNRTIKLRATREYRREKAKHAAKCII